MKFRRFLFFVFLIIYLSGYSQTNLTKYLADFPADSLMQIIQQNQSIGDAFFDEGIFVSYRNHSLSSKYWKDDNIFFSQIIAFALLNLKEQLDDEDKVVAENIIEKVILNYPKYKNKDGFITYNFWKTRPSKHYPNSKWLRKYRKFIVPDDMDDTSMAYLTSAQLDDSVLLLLKKEMIRHSNGFKDEVKHIPEKYKSYKAYSTWFGKNMPIEFDISVLSNVLYLIYEKNLSLNVYDSACLFLIRDIVINRDHLKKPSYFSPSYKTTPVILYHLIRLISAHNPEILEPLIPQLTEEIKTEFNKSKSVMEKVILSTSLLRLGINLPDIIIDKRTKNDIDGFSFYSANYATMLILPLRKWFLRGEMFSSKYICPAYNYTLLFEYKVLHREYMRN